MSAFHPSILVPLQLHWLGVLGTEACLCSLQLCLKQTDCPILGDDSIVGSLLPGNNKNEKILRQASAAAVFSFR
ncbi:hypothetical protein I79_026202 [Cricetulus griseus]|uniref:Secreted protein n=1 Tax=Cricetulus griseus TaxID=10029 RepID=G3IQ99_CRIGR|nr:hypothetical protein I79_026202 [Cricetulus griseus]